jgi:hypothetical protein
MTFKLNPPEENEQALIARLFKPITGLKDCDIVDYLRQEADHRNSAFNLTGDREKASKEWAARLEELADILELMREKNSAWKLEANQQRTFGARLSDVVPVIEELRGDATACGNVDPKGWGALTALPYADDDEADYAKRVEKNNKNFSNAETQMGGEFDQQAEELTDRLSAMATLARVIRVPISTTVSRFLDAQRNDPGTPP